MSSSYRALLVDDNERDHAIIRDLLTRITFADATGSKAEIQMEWVSNFDDAYAALTHTQTSYDICLLNHSLGTRTGLELLGVLPIENFTPVIMLTDSEDHEIDVKATLAGAADYLVKRDLTAPLLERSIRYAVRYAMERAKREAEATRREATLQEVQQQSQLLATAVSNLTDGMLVTDARKEDNPIIFCNPSFCAMTGYSAHEVIGRNCRFLQGSESDSQTVQEIRQAIQEQRSCSVTIRNYRKDGTPFWNSLKITPVFDAQGQLTNFVGLQSDVTSQREAEIARRKAEIALQKTQAHAEEALRKNEARFRTIFETSLDAILLANDDGVYVDANPAACTLLGVERQQLKGRSVADFVTPTTKDAVRAAWEDFLREGQQMGEFEIQQLNGTQRHAEYRAVAGLQSGIHMAVLRDITERKQAEATLLESEARFRTAISEAPIPIMIHREDGKVLQISKGWTEYSGYEIEDVPTIQDWVERAYAQDSAEAHEYIKKLYQIEGTRSEGEWTIIAKNGEKRVWDFTTTPLGTFGDNKRVVINTAFDITQSKQATEALEARTREIVTTWESMTDAFFSLDLQWRFSHVNAQAGRLWQRNPQELIGKNMWEEFPTAVGSEFHTQYLRALEEQVVVDFEAYYAPTNVWREVHVYPSAHGLSVYFRDITERKQDELALRQSEERYRSLTLATSQIVWTSSPDGQMNDMPAWRTFTGQTFDEMQGNGWIQALHPDDRERLQKPWGNFKANGIYKDECRVRAAGGDYRLFAMRGVPVREEDGSIREWIGTFTDIHDRRQAEEQRDRFFTLSLDMLAIASFDGYFKRVNPAFLETLGWTEAEFLSTPFLELSHPDDKAATQVAVQNLAQGNTVVGFENRYRTKEGGWRWLEWKSVAVPHEGLIYAAARDVTERKQSEANLLRLQEELEARVEERTRELGRVNESLRVENMQHQMTLGTLREVAQALQHAKEEADSANAAKSEFLSRMSHELRTPLNAILGFGQILESQELSSSQREGVKFILKGGRHLLGLINEVLDIARVEAGHMEFSLEPIALSLLVTECCSLMEPLAEESQIQLINTFHDNGSREGNSPDSNLRDLAGFHVMADRQRLKQVVLNLLSNAIKYNQPQGQVTLWAQHLQGRRIQLRVQDTGQGLTQQQVKQLFTPFERLHATHSAIEGSGLGLVISKRLITAMGGTMGVESEVGEGSTFWLDLPKVDDLIETEGEWLSSTAPAAQIETQSTHTVLSIEDNISNIRLMEAIMESRPNVTLLTAMQGDIGLGMAHQHRPDVILLDMHMPGISGSVVLERLKQDSDTSSIPVIIISADATALQIERLLAAGASAYLTKPINVAEFLTTLDNLLQKKEV